MNVEELKSILSYDPDMGRFTWLVNIGRRIKEGQQAGCINGRGYWVTKIDGKQYKMHRLAWLYMTGNFPKCGIDHINRATNDNRFCNLREATPSQNTANSKVYGKSGLKGAYKNKRASTWVSVISHHYGKQYLGSFSSKEEAHAAYCVAARQLHGEFFSNGL